MALESIIIWIIVGGIAGTIADWLVSGVRLGCLGTVIIGIIGAIFAVVLIGVAIWIIGFFVLGIWAIYRIARGWLRLKDRQPMPMP